MNHFQMAWNMSIQRGLPAPWKKIYGTEFRGEKVPVGALVKCIPSMPRKKDPSNMPFAPRTEEGIFMGYHLNYEGG